MNQHQDADYERVLDRAAEALMQAGFFAGLTIDGRRRTVREVARIVLESTQSDGEAP